jgi:hypothetical protein
MALTDRHPIEPDAVLEGRICLKFSGASCLVDGPSCAASHFSVGPFVSMPGLWVYHVAEGNLQMVIPPEPHQHKWGGVAKRLRQEPAKL